MKLLRPACCALCTHTSTDVTRTDSMIRHMHRHHADKSQYTGYNELTGYTFTCVGDDYPHIVMATHPKQTTLGYCTQCFTGFYVKGVKTPAALAKHFKTHTCPVKQVRTRKVEVKTVDASGNVSLKKEMQTGAVKITAEMIEAYNKRPDMKNFGVEHHANTDIDVLTTIESAFKNASKWNSPATRAKLMATTEPDAAPAPVAAPVDGPVNWEKVCKELATHRRLKVAMPAMMNEEQERVEQTMRDAATDADVEIEELDWFEFMATLVYRAGRTEVIRKEKDKVLDQLDMKEGELTRYKFETQNEIVALRKLMEERDDENRKLVQQNRSLRAALEQCQSQQNKAEDIIEHEYNKF